MPRFVASILAVASVAACAGAVAVAAAQDAGGARVADLLTLIEAADRPAALEAAATLTAMGPSVAAELVAGLKQHRGCQAQLIVAGVLQEWKVEAAVVEATQLAVAQGRCTGVSGRDLVVQQDAALRVVDRPSGVRALTAMLRGEDPFGRRKAAVAFDALTRRLEGGAAPDAIPATAALLEATEAALPALKKVAVDEDDEPTRCAAYAALQQAKASAHARLRSRATALLERVTVTCGPKPGAPAPKTTSARPRESAADLVRKLDRQEPETLTQTTDALLAMGRDAVPLLVDRLGRTDRCRGLALAAGILAKQDEAPQAVDQAFLRVLRGDCQGREPFDLRLAQTIAGAYMTQAGGVTTMVTLLTAADVTVRRRAAESFANLFDRMGLGSHAAGEVDPAVVEASRGSLPALVTAASADRDETVRCLTVRALERAQRSVHETVRVDAEAATAGRSLRCLTR